MWGLHSKWKYFPYAFQLHFITQVLAFFALLSFRSNVISINLNEMLIQWISVRFSCRCCSVFILILISNSERGKKPSIQDNRGGNSSNNFPNTLFETFKRAHLRTSISTQPSIIRSAIQILCHLNVTHIIHCYVCYASALYILVNQFLYVRLLFY